MKYYIKTLTPIHIGNGEELSPLDYVIYDNVFYHISQKQFIDFLNNEQIDLNLYATWITENSTKINQLENEIKNDKKNIDKNQRLAKLRKNFNLLNFVENNEINKKQEFIKYLKENENIIKINLGNKKINEKNIRGFLKNGKNQPYIPGTSIKGAIRTALLYHYLSQYASTKDILNILNRNLRNKEIKKESFTDEIENLAFYCGFQKNENVDISYQDEKFDILKFLIVSDGKINNGNSLTIDNLNLYLIDKDKNGSYANIQKQAPTIEALKENTIIEFDIDFNIDYLLTITKNYNRSNDRIEVKIGNQIEYQWIGLKDKIKKVFDFDITQIDETQKEELKKQIIKTIFQKVSNFSKEQKEWDNKWLKEIKEKNTKIVFNNQHIKNGFEKINGENLIHLGFGTGFIGTTELLYLIQDVDLKGRFKEVMEKFLIGDKPGAQKQRKNGECYNANPDKFPKSKRLVTRDDIIMPLGWGLISENINNNAQNTEKETKEDFKPSYYEGKVKAGVSGINAIVTHSGKPNKVKLFIKKYENFSFDLTGYSSELPLNTIISVKLNVVSKKGQIIQVGFEKILKKAD